MVSVKDVVKVTDFGLAKIEGSLQLTKTSSTVGTVAFVSPEQIQSSDVDNRSGIFSLGVVLFEMLTGRLPFRGEHEAAIMYSVLNEPPQSLREVCPNLPDEPDKIVRKALEKDPALRFQGVGELITELRKCEQSPQQEHQHERTHRKFRD